jgi:hypothetical protein
MGMTTYEIVAVLATIGFLVGVIYFVKMARSVSRAAKETEYTVRRVSELTPAAQRFMATAESELDELRIMTRGASEIVGDVQTVTGEASAATLNLVRGIEHRVLDRYSAIVAGARAGLGILKRARGNGYDSDPDDVHEGATQIGKDREP